MEAIARKLLAEGLGATTGLGQEIGFGRSSHVCWERS